MLATYSFLDVNCALVGPGIAINIGAGSAASDEGISIEASENINQMTVAADSAVMHSLHANKSGKVTLSLLKTSPINAKLQLAYNLQTSSGSLHGQNTISLANNVTGETVTCQAVAFAKGVPLGYKKVAGMNVWEFDAGIIDRILGANT